MEPDDDCRDIVSEGGFFSERAKRTGSPDISYSLLEILSYGIMRDMQEQGVLETCIAWLDRPDKNFGSYQGKVELIDGDR